jgi:limonene-1,2-epoxide hydrolase
MATERQTDEIRVVEEFLTALEKLDAARAGELLAESVSYQNVPFPPARGKAAVMRQLEGMTRYLTSFEVVHHNIAANGPVVLTERTDIIGIGPVRTRLWVCGTFEVHDGRITLWRDRFDFVDATYGLLRGSARALVRRLRERQAVVAT